MQNKISYNKYTEGQAMISSVVFFVLISLVIVSGLVSPVVREFKVASDAFYSKKSFFLAESGIEDAHYRLLSGITHLDSGSYDIYIGSDFTTVEIGALSAFYDRTINSTGNSNRRKRRVSFKTQYENTITFQSGMQFGKGGMLFQGSGSWAIGNIFSDGPIVGTNTNLVSQGGAFSSGPNGLVNNIRFGSYGYVVKAHTISNSFISGDAYYTNISNSTVNGNSYTPSPDPASFSLPITDSMIQKMEQSAESGGVYKGSCPYNISSGIVNLGPLKIPCSDLNISGSAVVNVTGPVWVTGNISISNTASVVANGDSDSSISVPMIADNPLDRISSSKITLSSSATLTGTGSDSYIILISQNNSAEEGGLQDAISFRNSGSSSKLVLYAGHGHLNIQTTSSSSLAQLISGYKATLTSFNSVLSGKSTQTTLSFPVDLLNIWSFEQWQEI